MWVHTKWWQFLELLFWIEFQNIDKTFILDIKHKKSKFLGRDEKGCKMDVDGRRQASTVDGLEKCSLVEVDH